MFQELIMLCLAGQRLALPQDWWSAWSLAPITLVPLLALLAWLLARRQAAVALAGWLLLAIALVSPLCRLAATLAFAHMAQLMVLVAGCALLARGLQGDGPLQAFHGSARAPGPRMEGRGDDGQPRSTAGARRPRARPNLAVAALAHGALLWLLHLPAIYALMLLQPVPHAIAYALLLASAWWFWRAVLEAAPAQRGAALLALLATTAHTGLLGALLTFASAPLYPLHTAGARAWGLDLLQDQQLAGLTMWVVGALGYLAVALGLVLQWFTPDRSTRADGAPLASCKRGGVGSV